MYSVPNAQCALPHTLSEAQLDQEEGYALQDEHHEKGDEEGTYNVHIQMPL